MPLPKVLKEGTTMAKKGLNLKVYGILAIVITAVILTVLTVYTFTSKYTAFDPEKMAVAYVDTIVQTGDGYNSYKDTLVSFNSKYGDFIRENYINPIVKKGYNSTPLDDESLKGEKTLNDDGSLSGEVTDTMYPYYVQLITDNNGFDNYELIFSSYISKLITTREEIFGDKFFDDEVFFTAFEANVTKYGKTLTGTEDVFDSNSGVQTEFASVGAYQKKYGKDYRISVVSTGTEDAAIPDVSSFNIDKPVSECKVCTVNVSVDGVTEVEDLKITVVKIGKSWYVDNELCDTSVLYNFYK